jgi:hypothetical protein
MLNSLEFVTEIIARLWRNSRAHPYLDHGAMGESLSMTAVVKVTDTAGPLNKSSLPCLDLPFNACYFPDRWLDNKTLQVHVSEIPFVKAGFSFDSTAVRVNGINCKVVPYEYAKGLAPVIGIR